MTTAKKKAHNKWQKDLAKNLGHISWCEACGDPNCKPVDYAHRLKRAFIGWETEEDYLEYTYWVARLGRPCHKVLDENFNKNNDLNFDAHQIMYDKITSLVNNRVEDIHIA